MRRIEPGLLGFLAALVILLVSAPSVWAAGAEQIGLAVVVRNNVSRLEPTVAKILQGDDVVRDEVVQTFNDSSAKFVLKDSTNLVLGPNSKLKLDRAVFSGEKGLGDVAIKLTEGSFRFITGNSAKESYTITTPIATMGVRGTTLDLLIERFKNTVVLKEGQAQVCAERDRCVDLTKIGDTAVVTANGSRRDIQLQPSSTWSFDSACGGMCSPMTFAQAENSLTTGSIDGGPGGAAGGGGGGTGVTGNAASIGGGFQAAQGSETGVSRSFLAFGASAAAGGLSNSVSPR